MPKLKTKPDAGPKIAAGKARIGFVLPEEMIEEITTRAARERKWPAYIAERLIAAGLASEGDGAPRRPSRRRTTAQPA